jgi:hypothetical protein
LKKRAKEDDMQALAGRTMQDTCPYRDRSGDVCGASVSGMKMGKMERWRTKYCEARYEDCVLLLAMALRAGASRAQG